MFQANNNLGPGDYNPEKPKANMPSSNFGKDKTAGRMPVDADQERIEQFIKDNVLPKPTNHVTNKRRNAQLQLLTFESSLAYKNSGSFASKTERKSVFD